MEVLKDALIFRSTHHKEYQWSNDTDLHGSDCILDFRANRDSYFLWLYDARQTAVSTTGTKPPLLGCPLEL